jgi:CRISPR-associated protein Cas2
MTEEIEEYVVRKKYHIVVIYDISDNKKRNKVVRILKSYGFRVQKSCFETVIERKKYDKLLKRLEPFGTPGDSIRVYKIRGENAVTVFGDDNYRELEEVIVI